MAPQLSLIRTKENKNKTKKTTKKNFLEYILMTKIDD